MNLASETIGDVEVIEVLEKNLDADTAQLFKTEMTARLTEGGKIIFDLGMLEFIDSSGLGAMLSCLRKLNATGGDLKLCSLSASVRSMFELVRMHRVIEIYETREEAIASL